MGKRAVVVLAPGFEEIEAVTQIDVLRRAGVTVIVTGITTPAAEGAHGLSVEVDETITDVTDTPDAVIFPGGMPGAKYLGESEECRALAERVAASGGIVAAICAAPALTLAKWGLLDGKTATCYPSFETEFGPSTTFSEEDVVVDGTIVTSRAPGTALAFALTLAGMLVDGETADKLREGMLAG